MSEREQGRPERGLESWLDRKIRHGHLKGLPPFASRRGGDVQPSESYARRLLAKLRDPNADPREIDLVKDDGRAFRSWVESNHLDLVWELPHFERARAWAT